jgi:hypothetical protein
MFARLFFVELMPGWFDGGGRRLWPIGDSVATPRPYEVFAIVQDGLAGSQRKPVLRPVDTVANAIRHVDHARFLHALQPRRVHGEIGIVGGNHRVALRSIEKLARAIDATVYDRVPKDPT